MVAPYEVGDPVRSYVKVPGSGKDKTARALCCDLSRVSPIAASAPIPPGHVQDSQLASPSDELPGANQDVSNGVETKTGELKENLERKNSVTVRAREDRQATTSPSQEISSNDETPENKQVSNPRKRNRIEETGGDDRGNAGPKRTKMTPNGNDRCACSVGTNTAGHGSQTLNGNKGRQDGNDESIHSVGANTAGCRSQSPSVATQTNEPANAQPNEPMNEVVKERNRLREQNTVLERRLAVFRDLFRNKERLTRLLRALEVPS